MIVTIKVSSHSFLRMYLLKGVVLEVLKAKNVEDTNGVLASGTAGDLIDAENEPGEKTRVDGLGKGIALVDGLANTQWLDKVLAGRNGCLALERGAENLRRQVKETSDKVDKVHIGDGRRLHAVLFALGIRHVAQVQNACQQAEDSLNLLDLESHHFQRTRAQKVVFRIVLVTSLIMSKKVERCQQ